MHIRVVISGRNYHAAESGPTLLTLADGCSVDDALAALAAGAPEGKRLSGSCLVAVSGIHLGTVQHHQPQVLRDGDELMIIAPVAGG